MSGEAHLLLKTKEIETLLAIRFFTKRTEQPSPAPLDLVKFVAENGQIDVVQIEVCDESMCSVQLVWPVPYPIVHIFCVADSAISML